MTDTVHKKSLAQIEKEVTYAEGILHGFGEAQQVVRDAFGGAFTLNKTENIKAWEARDKRLRDERSVLRNLQAIANPREQEGN